MKNLSVVLATYNEEKHIGECLNRVQDIATEIIVVDGTSSDKTRQIAKEYGARVIKKDNPKIFHINKQIALENAKYKWILQLDADERVSDELIEEICSVIQACQNMILMNAAKIDEIEKIHRRN